MDGMQPYPFTRRKAKRCLKFFGRPARPSRPLPDQKTRQLCDPSRLAPVRQIGQTIRANRQPKLGVGMPALELGEGGYRVGGPRSLFLQFINAKGRMAGYG